MRRFLIAFAAVVFCAASSWADSILVVTASATFTATQNCSSNCLETIDMSFQYVPPSINNLAGEIVPGTLNVTSSGFLGSFTGGSLNLIYVPSFNSLGDEIDLNIPGNQGIQVGVNTLSFYLWSCQSQACDNAFGETWAGLGPGDPTSGSSTVTPVAVPDGSSFTSLTLAALGAFGVASRWRRKDARQT
jgi:hypothetical protein